MQNDFIISRFIQDVDLDESSILSTMRDSKPTIEEAQRLGRFGQKHHLAESIKDSFMAESEYVQRSLEENQFWLRIMMEHAFFIKAGLPHDATHLIKQCDEFQKIFEKQLERSFETLRDPADVEALNQDTIILTHKITAFKEKILNDTLTGRVRGFNFPLLLEHVRREALYFLKTIKQINSRIEKPVEDDIVEENVFFLNIMAEHSKFIAHLLDPTEQTLIRQARAMGQEFDVLLYQARNIQVEPPSTDRLRTQLTISKGATLELRTFKEQATKLVEQAQVRSAIDPRLAAHITREAGKFLSIIDRLEERIN
jgi:Domain of unknown function (DUF2935)